MDIISFMKNPANPLRIFMGHPFERPDTNILEEDLRYLKQLSSIIPEGSVADCEDKVEFLLSYIKGKNLKELHNEELAFFLEEVLDIPIHKRWREVRV
jgi:hypothetical protein